MAGCTRPDCGSALDDVFRDEELPIYAAHPPAQDPEKTAKVRATTPEVRHAKWRSWQMSDDAPLLFAIRTDFTEGNLREIAEAV